LAALGERDLFADTQRETPERMGRLILSDAPPAHSTKEKGSQVVTTVVPKICGGA